MSNIIYLSYTGNLQYLHIYDEDGAQLYLRAHSGAAYSINNDPVAMNEDYEAYIAGRWADKIKKLRANGLAFTEAIHQNPYQIAINADGDIWTYGFPSDNNLTKIDPDTLAILDTEIIDSGDYSGMAFDSDGYLYMINWVTDYIEKWDMSTKTKDSQRALPAGDLTDMAIYSSLAVIGTNVYLAQYANDEGNIFSCPTDLSSDFVRDTPGADLDNDFPAGNDYVMFLTSDGANLIVAGLVSSVRTVAKYDTNYAQVWKITPSGGGSTGLGIAAYPFEAVAAVYDYPLYPVIW